MNEIKVIKATKTRNSEGRERVLREAHTLFLERGFAEVSMQQIADAAGMTKAALYYHFRNKEDLFVQIVHNEVTRFINGVTEELDGIESFAEQLRRFAMFAFRATKSDFSRLIGDFKRHVSDECQEQVRLEERETHDPTQILRPYFQRAHAAGELRDIDVDHAMALFLSMVGGLFMLSRQKPEIQLTNELAATIVDTYLNGVGNTARA